MSAAGSATGGSYGAREFGAGEWSGANWRRSGGSRWSAFEIIAMVLGFIVFWPIGLAILGYKLWHRRYGGPDLQTLATSKWQDARTRRSANSPNIPTRSAAPRTARNSTGSWPNAGLARPAAARTRTERSCFSDG
jgi:hypothetical protein